jgi:hypothetical protein
MTAGETLFAQLMDFVPWSTFARIVERYDGDRRVRTLSCGEQYRAMAFAQLTYRESLRDIETCLSVHALKLYHMGFRQPVRRSTLADANEGRDWRIYAEVAQWLITQARKLYANEDLGLDLTDTVYALDATTIDLCLSVFPWAHFRTAKAAVKMHTLLDLRGGIPSFIHISDGKVHDVHALDMLMPEAGAVYVMDRAYVDFTRLHALHQAGAFFVTRAKSNMDAHRVYSAPTDRATGLICDQTISLDGNFTSRHYPGHLRRIRFKDPETGKTLVFIHQQLRPSGRHHLCLVQMPLAGGTLLQMDQAASSHQAVLRHLGKRGQDADLDRRLGLRPRRHRQEASRPGRLALHFAPDPLGHPFRENAHRSSTCQRRQQMQPPANNQPIGIVRFLTGH